jgi:hypothetical protein
MTNSADPRIYEQIERTADYYEPDRYTELLSFFHDIEINSDRLSGEFYPLSAVAQRARNPKIFAVGILPPSVTISGKVLDRSATIANSNPGDAGVGGPTDQATADNAREKSASEGWVAGTNGIQCSGEPGVDQGCPNITSLSYQQMAVLMRDAYFTRWHTYPSPTELAIYVAQSIRETGGRWPNNNPGFIGNYTKEVDSNGRPIRPIPNGRKTFQYVYGPNTGSMAGKVEYYISYDSPQAGAQAFINNITTKDHGAARAAAQEGDLFGYVKALKQGGYFGDTVNHYYGGFTDIEKLKAKIGNVVAQVGTVPPDYRPVTGDASSGNYLQNGSSNAKAAAKQRGKVARTPLNSTDFGKKLTAAQNVQIKAAQDALQRMKDVPPLRMLVNPQKFSVKGQKIVSDGNRSRRGPIIEHWGDDQEKVSASGKVAGFYAIDQKNANGPGLTRHARNFSQAWQNFQSLFLLYKNNAGMYLKDFAGQEGDRNLAMLGSIYIYYDNTLYIGSFDSFSITETDTSPFTVEYSYEFSVRASFLLDQAPTEQSYGAPSMFQKAPTPVLPASDVVTPIPLPPLVQQAIDVQQAEAQQAEAQQAVTTTAKKPTGTSRKAKPRTAPTEKDTWNPAIVTELPQPEPVAIPPGSKIHGGTVGPDGHTLLNDQGEVIGSI